MFDEADSKYLVLTAPSKGKLNSSAEESANGSKWKITLSNIVNVSNSNYYLQYNTGSPRFACYTHTQKDVVLYKKDDSSSKTATTVTFGSEVDNKTFALNIGDDFTAPTATLTPAEAGSITYSSDNEAVAKVDATTGAVTLGETAGTAKITASFEGNDTYAASSASYTINLTKPFVVEDGVFDFNGEYDYGSGVEPTNSTSDDTYVKSSVWIADNVTFTTANNGGNGIKWWIGTSKKTLRCYAKSLLTISVPSGCVITAINFTGLSNGVTPNIGTFKNGNWSGKSQIVVFTVGDTKKDISSITVTYEKASTIEDVTLHVGPTGYATLYYSDRALEVPENAKACTYAVLEGLLIDNHPYNAGSVIPAGEAVVVSAPQGDYTFKATTTTETKDPYNMLLGTDEDADLEPDDQSYFYMLSLNSKSEAGSVGFYWGNATGAAFKLGAHKAYLKVPKDEAASAKAFVFGGNPTGIKTIMASEDNADAPLYNLAGQRVGKSYKGIVIRNGKKYVK